MPFATTSGAGFSSRSYRSAIAKCVGFAITSVARDAEAIIRWRDRSRASERRRALISGSPSACLCSSLISCLVMRSSRRQWKRAQARSIATSTIVAMQIAETIRIAMVRIISGNATGSVYIASNALASDERSTKTTTAVTDTSLKSDFANSTRPWVPKIRLQPLTGEIRERSGMMRWSTRLGAFCSSDAASPNTAMMTTNATRNRNASRPTTVRRFCASAALLREKPSGSSRKLFRVGVNCCTPWPIRNVWITISAAIEAKMEASRETGILPCSSASRTFFSVGSSVLLSWSDDSAMPVQRSAEDQLILLLGVELDLALLREVECEIGDHAPCLQHVALVRRLADGELVLDDATDARGDRGQDQFAEVLVGALQRDDDAVRRHLVEDHGARLRRQVDDVVEREQQLLQHFGRLRPLLRQALQHVLDVAALHLVDDVGDPGVGVRTEVAGEVQRQVFMQRLLENPHGIVDDRLEAEHAPHQLVAQARWQLAHDLGGAGRLDLGQDERRSLRMLL